MSVSVCVCVCGFEQTLCRSVSLLGDRTSGRIRLAASGCGQKSAGGYKISREILEQMLVFLCVYIRPSLAALCVYLACKRNSPQRDLPEPQPKLEERR